MSPKYRRNLSFFSDLETFLLSHSRTRAKRQRHLMLRSPVFIGFEVSLAKSDSCATLRNEAKQATLRTWRPGGPLGTQPRSPRLTPRRRKDFAATQVDCGIAARRGHQRLC